MERCDILQELASPNSLYKAFEIVLVYGVVLRTHGGREGGGVYYNIV